MSEPETPSYCAPTETGISGEYAIKIESVDPNHSSDDKGHGDPDNR